jgi:hypothetical protein
MTSTRKPTSAKTMQTLADRTTAEGLLAVRARKITEALWKNSEEYHAGAIDMGLFREINLRLWAEAELAGIASDVKRHLRNAR